MPLMRRHAVTWCVTKKEKETLQIKLSHSVESLSIARCNLISDTVKYEKKMRVFKEMIYGDDTPPIHLK